MSFLIKDKGITFELDDCFDCPHIKGPLPANMGQREAYVCEKKKRIVTMYDKNCRPSVRWKAFEHRHDGKDFPAWCPIVKARTTGKDEDDFVDVFD